MLAYFSYRIVAETALLEAIWRTAVRNFSDFVLASFMVCVRDDFCSRSAKGARIRSRGARGVFFWETSFVLGIVEDEPP